MSLLAVISVTVGGVSVVIHVNVACCDQCHWDASLSAVICVTVGCVIECCRLLLSDVIHVTVSCVFE